MRGATRKEWLGLGGMMLCCASIVASPKLAESPIIKRLVPLSAADQKLIDAVKKDDLQGVKIALAEGADINCQDRARFHSCTQVMPKTYYTPLTLAVIDSPNDHLFRKGAPKNYRMFKYLLQCGADPNFGGINGSIRLKIATKNLLLYERGREAVDLLLQHGAIPSEKTKQLIEVARENMESKPLNK